MTLRNCGAGANAGEGRGGEQSGSRIEKDRTVCYMLVLYGLNTDTVKEQRDLPSSAQARTPMNAC